jgi:hypothetical protein
MEYPPKIQTAYDAWRQNQTEENAFRVYQEIRNDISTRLEELFRETPQ